jgi:ELWxxDGT repeat protein
MMPWTRSIARLFTADRKPPQIRRRSSLSVEQLEARNLMSASPIAFKSGIAYDSLSVNGTYYFSTEGGELWKTDGTTGDTFLVKDFAPLSSSSSGPFAMTNVNGTLYFIYYDVANNWKPALWKPTERTQALSLSRISITRFHTI